MGNFDTATINIFILIFLIIASTVAYLYYIYQQEKKLEVREKTVLSDYRKIIGQAHERALNILKKASAQSKDFAKDTKITNELIEETSNDLMQKFARESVTSLNTITRDFITEYKSSLSEAKSQYHQQVAQTLDEMSKSATQELSIYREKLATQSASQEHQLTQSIQTEFAKAKEEIEAYKKHKMDIVDTSIKELLLKVSEKVLGQTIPLSQHEKLIQHALEQAKQEGLFTQNA